MSKTNDNMFKAEKLSTAIYLASLSCQADHPDVVIVDENGSEYRVMEVQDSLSAVQIHVVKTYDGLPPVPTA